MNRSLRGSPAGDGSLVADGSLVGRVLSDPAADHASVVGRVLLDPADNGSLVGRVLSDPAANHGSVVGRVLLDPAEPAQSDSLVPPIRRGSLGQKPSLGGRQSASVTRPWRYPGEY